MTEPISATGKQPERQDEVQEYEKRRVSRHSISALALEYLNFSNSPVATI
jgi:hypothetical protein